MKWLFAYLNEKFILGAFEIIYTLPKQEFVKFIVDRTENIGKCLV